MKDPKDRALKSMAERYVNLVKVQEWSDLSGKFRTVAQYVKHDPNFTTVTIESVKGRGAERTTKEVTVPVDKLSKTCQSRVRQIDTMQKKIKEMAKAKPGETALSRRLRRNSRRSTRRSAWAGGRAGGTNAADTGSAGARPERIRARSTGVCGSRAHSTRTAGWPASATGW